MARQLGLANDTGVEITAAQGRLTWCTDTNYQDGLTLMAAIGQGNTAVTPLQLAQYAAALANYGRKPTPAFCRLRRAACHRRSRVAVRAGFYRDPRRRSCVRPHPGWHEADGPDRPRPAGGPCYRCGQDRQPPSWPPPLPGGSHYVNSVLIGYAPADDPQIAMAVVLEYGGGGANGAPVMRAVLTRGLNKACMIV